MYPDFFNALKTGLLKPLVDRVRSDRTLMLALRGDSINVYYRGGNLLRISRPEGSSSFKARFDPNYNKSAKDFSDLPGEIEAPEQLSRWLRAIPELKDSMDHYFAAVAEKLEREFQQVVARENNDSVISNETEYFICDIEYADTGARFDMLAIKWPRAHRKHLDKCRMCLIEMKYGDNAYVGTSGLREHLLALDRYLNDPVKVNALRVSMQDQFNQLRALELVGIRQTNDIKLSDERPEVVILLANHHPGKSNLGKILKEVAEADEFAGVGSGKNYDLRFFVASFAGYGLHNACMLGLDQFREYISVVQARA
jgi:hypothetical protein